MHKTVFLDRDGTLVKDPGYVHKPEDLEFTEKAIQGLKKLQGAGFLLLVVSNQSGIPKGHFTEQQMHKFNEKMLSVLEENGVHIEKIYFCLHAPEACCGCRKPETGMIEQAKKDFEIDFTESFMVGDQSTDIEFAHKAGIKAVILSNGRERFKADFAAKNLLEAAEWILSEGINR